MLNHETILAGAAAGAGGYEIENACRFNDNDSARLERTPGAAGDSRTKWSVSFWVKFGALPINLAFFSGGADNGNHTRIVNDDSGQIRLTHFDGGAFTTNLQTTGHYRDPSAYMHVLVIWDSDNATADDRHRIYINGVQVTDFVARTNPSSGKQSDIGAAIKHLVGARPSPSTFMEGYLADFYYIDGIIKSPSDFGKTDPTTGQWVPIEYTGTFGTNGFYLDFADAADLGNDVSGNANDFTSSGLATNDQVTDTPTNNYCVLNAIDKGTGTLSDGNLVSTGSTDRSATFGVSSGKWAWKVTADATASFGVVEGSLTGTESTYAATSADVLEFELDVDAGTLDVRVNGGGATSVATGLSGTYLPLMKGACTCDFGQSGFNPTDSAFKTLNAKNLPSPSIVSPSAHFQSKLYTGNAASSRAITQDSPSTFGPDLVWIKNRDQADEWKALDTTRGATKELNIDSDNAESTDANGLTAFSATDGFTLGTGAGGYNDNAEDFLALMWEEGATPGLDIVRYTGTGVAHAESHGLGVVPAFIIVKQRTDAGRSWNVYHEGVSSDPETDYLLLSTSAAMVDDITRWNDTAPTTTQFTVGTAAALNENTKNFVAYLFAGVEGFSKFGSYTGNGNADGPFVWCGFGPKFIVVKNSGASGNWVHHDTDRSPYNPAGNRLDFDTANTESADNTKIDILSNGFKIRNASTGDNTNGVTYVFAAWAEFPFKYANAR